MLKLTNIKKDYLAGIDKVHALKGVSVEFRKNEFVSILGHSGCGKTTLLNIIGGLDHYTSGDLMIDNVSTKNYNDRDWDTYRSRKIGFIFQSYNLIPHQTILENVELALNISGIEKKKRIKKAKDALEKVGLAGQYNKRPNQLSGGQCQRVAIARALVNEPEILLADEPTGALDSATSIQIMELIKEIAKERLVIMVTHNPELAEQYSTRIIKLSDGEILSDTNPFKNGDDDKPIEKKRRGLKKSKLSLWNAFKLSARNLRSKFKRTLMVCFAGSIGIIGVASVLAVSSGITGYINNMQDDMLSGNPITISEETYDFSALMNISNEAKTKIVKENVRDGYINVDKMVEELVKTENDMSSIKVENDITKEYVDYVLNMPKEYYYDIVTDYDIDLTNNIYTSFKFDGQSEANYSLSSARYIYTQMLNHTEFSKYSSYITSIVDTFAQTPSNQDFVLSQYDFVGESGYYPTKEDEIMIVINNDSEITDLLLAELGYYSQEEFFNVIYKAINDEKYNSGLDKYSFSYDELLGKEFIYYNNDIIYNKVTPEIQTNPFTYNHIANSDWEGLKLKITGILKPKDNLAYGCLESGFYYTKALTNKFLQDNKNSEISEYLNNTVDNVINSTNYSGNDIGITYKVNFNFEGIEYNSVSAFVGEIASSSIMGSMMGTSVPSYYSLSLRNVGGNSLANDIKIYAIDFDLKNNITAYLDKWNEDGDLSIGDRILTKSERNEIKYTDNLALVINLINDMINIVTYALVAFTALSLVVSTVMIAIITYVSVIERIKEIGVIRSLGGRKKDVAHLFNAETFIIGFVSGLIGIAVTYLLSFVLNLIVGNLTGIYTIASLPVLTAFVLIVISVLLTLISGLIPAKVAANKDPVEAIRSE